MPQVLSWMGAKYLFRWKVLLTSTPSVNASKKKSCIYKGCSKARKRNSQTKALSAKRRKRSLTKSGKRWIVSRRTWINCKRIWSGSEINRNNLYIKHVVDNVLMRGTLYAAESLRAGNCTVSPVWMLIRLRCGCACNTHQSNSRYTE